MSEFLLEIGVQELPSDSVQDILNQLKSKFKNFFNKCQLKSFCTYRRLILYAKGDFNKTVLKEALTKKVLNNFKLAESMWWEDSRYRFLRPIDWILCLLDKEVIKFKVADVTSSRKTFFIDPKTKLLKSKSIKDPRDFFKFLDKQGIFYDQRMRREHILAGFKKIAKRFKCKEDFDSTLLEEVNFLTESPFIFVGSFKEEYLKLPSQVLIASMSKYQRIFPLIKEDGSLINKFIGVLETRPKNLNIVRRNYENVLDARLKDALYFMKEDLKVSLKERAKDLKDLIFLEGLGSFYEKIQRIRELAEFIYQKIENKPELNIQEIELASCLIKADLVTNMVREFPSLQGVVGSFYAKTQGFSEQVCKAIYEHYLPKTFQDKIPQSFLGKLMSLADKLDNITGIFSKGFKPTGEADPFGLKRQAVGIIRILSEGELICDLEELVEKSCQIIGFKEIAQILDFFRERIKTLALNFTKRKDLIEALLATKPFKVWDFFKRLKELDALYEFCEFTDALKVYERCYRILKPIFKKEKELPPLNEAFLIEFPEKELYKEFLKLKSEVEVLLKEKKYDKIIKVYSQILPSVHNFFDKVLVNVEDKNLKMNRARLLYEIYSPLKENVADFMKLKGR